MLVEFRVKNFKSFKDEQVFRLVSTGVKDNTLTDNIHTVKLAGGDEFTLVTAAVVYGSNASGKTNLIDAIKFVEKIVAHPLDQTIRKRDNTLEIEPFLLSKSSSQSPSEFELTFIQEGVLYRYGFTLDSRKIHEEWLYAYPEGSQQRWFQRTIIDPQADKPEYDWYFRRDKFKKSREFLKPKSRSDMLFLNVAVEFNDEGLIKVHNWFLHNLNYIYSENISPIYTLRRVDEDSVAKERVANFLREADLGVADFSLERTDFAIENLPSDMPSELREQVLLQLKGSQLVNVQIAHYTDQPGVLVNFPLEKESLGTRRLFELSGLVLDVLECGGILFVDELEASLHPTLLTNIIQLFGSREINPKGAQLVFTTHNPGLLNPKLFRRDQIWFVEKKQDGASRLYPLTDIRPRIGEALEKNYLEGRYGAVPIVGELVERR